MISACRMTAVLTLFCFLFGCQPINNSPDNSQEFTPVQPDFATAFSMAHLKEDRVLYVLDNVAGDTIQEIHCTQEGTNKSSALYLPASPQRVICLSTTHIPYMLELGLIDNIVGVANPELIYASEIRTALEREVIKGVGNDQALNFEKLINLHPDLVLMYDFGPGTASTIRRIEEFGLPVVRIQEFREQNPLGKAEWIRFFGVLFNKVQLADSIFNGIQDRYEAIISQTKSIETNRPTVFTGLPWKGEWYQPGGRSFQAMFFQDAGGNYLWSENEDVAGIVLDREVIYNKAIDADYWLNPGNAATLSEIIDQDERHGAFVSFKNHQVFNCTKRVTAEGGNDYWESGILNPDLILTDLQTIFHPELFHERPLFYYKQLPAEP